MKIAFDTEFIDTGHDIELISIGMVREDGATFYAEAAGVDLDRANNWVHANVVPHLLGHMYRYDRQTLRTSILDFAGPHPNFVAYYCSYDWVVLCQLFGAMVDLPKGWPMFCQDAKWMADRVGLQRSDYPPEPTNAHNALADARWVVDLLAVIEAHTPQPLVLAVGTKLITADGRFFKKISPTEYEMKVAGQETPGPFISRVAEIEQANLQDRVATLFIHGTDPIDA